MTVAITCDGMLNYVIGGVIVGVGAYVEDYVVGMLGFAKKHVLIDVMLFDRGFNSWELIDKLKQLKVFYIIFWKKQGGWYREIFDRMKDGEFERIL